VATRDLAHEGKPKAGACPGLGVSATVERRKDALEFILCRTRTLIPDANDREVTVARDAHLGWWGAVTLGILEQVTQKPAQQTRIATQLLWAPFEMYIVIAGTFLGSGR
jgi:hypothetical protein